MSDETVLDDSEEDVEARIARLEQETRISTALSALYTLIASGDPSLPSAAQPVEWIAAFTKVQQWLVDQAMEN